MEVFAVLAATSVALFVLVRQHRRNVDHLAQQHDDLQRAGDGPSPQDAGLRATGTSSWMRPGGF